jgi:hypothetical protein
MGFPPTLLLKNHALRRVVSMPSTDDPVLRSAKREALVVFVTWLAAMVYTVGYCYSYGYNRAPESLTFVLGFPDWVFWGIVVPWSVCVLFSFYFGATFVRDEDLGEELPEQEDDLGLGGG